MPRPRKSLINLSDTPYYHCMSRCVRRAFLCGHDAQNHKSYEHRRQWVEDRLLFLAGVFCIDVCAYAVMSNHTHVVLRINKQKAEKLTTKEILVRWHKLYRGMLLSRRFVNPAEQGELSDTEIRTVQELAEVYRSRLYDISWFMRLLNEYIARRANKEDECTGHFWEGRFKSQALLDEAALAACMTYVDLNPVRAGLADSPAHSSHTSIKKRIEARKYRKQPRRLSPLADHANNRLADELPFQIEDYFSLVEASRHLFQHNKPRRVRCETNAIIIRTGLCDTDWKAMVCGIERDFIASVSRRKLVLIQKRCVNHT
ncbi:transposase [Salinimonas lutimaris]|uniref:transposase n=1 Tax=Salinimonas lutimaris TaxID=914153 RepID=UPI0010BFD43F|nr:transposase [Salinimonas lutimaris]